MSFWRSCQCWGSRTSTAGLTGRGWTVPHSRKRGTAAGSACGYRARLRFGDLVFFNTTGESPSHVGVYIEDDLFAHASVTYGVTISSMESSYYRDRFVGARRIIP